jgi:hypothetical protein
MQDSEHDTHDPAVAAALRALARDDEMAGASPRVEERLRHEVRAIARARRREGVVPFALAASLFLLVAASVWLVTIREPIPNPAAPRVGASSGEVATAFFPLTPGYAPLTGGHVVRMEVPRRALASFGLAAGAAAEGLTSGTVLADVIVGDDGLARAVRFVHSGTQGGQQR